MADFREKLLSFDRLKKKVHIAHDVKINQSVAFNSFLLIRT